MTAYFRVSGSPNDLALLPPGIRNHQELANVAARAEALVISFYSAEPRYFLYCAVLGLQGFLDTSWDTGEDITATGAPATAVVPQVRVYLRGYKQNASDAAVDPNLAAAMRWAISDVIRWVMQSWIELEPGVQASTTTTDGGVNKSKSFKTSSEQQLPTEWQAWLDPYDSRQMCWGW